MILFANGREIARQSGMMSKDAITAFAENGLRGQG